MTTAIGVQRQLLSMGFALPKFGADGKPGDETWKAMSAALAELEAARGTPAPGDVSGMIDRVAFYLAVKKQGLFGGVLNASQVAGMEGILDGWEKAKLTDLRWLAYMLATAYHETSRTMRAIRETKAANDDAAIAILDRSFAAGKLSWVKTPYWHRDADGKSWLGRGLVQLTHKKNYQAMSDILGVDLVDQPSYALNDEIAVEIMIEGMTRGVSLKGDFTGKSLEDYFNATTEDWTNARRIINGVESAALVAGYGRKFHAALLAA